MFARLHPRWAPVVAVALGLYALVLLGSTWQSQVQLRAAADARLAADSRRRAIALGEFAAQRREFTEELADLHELHAYFANRALGMSARYGLDASLGALEQRLALAVSHDGAGAAKALTRVVFVDAQGQVLADTGGRTTLPPRAAPPGQAAPRGLTLDLAHHAIVASVPVTFKGEFQGTLLTYGDIDRLYQSLIQLDGGGSYREVLLTGAGDEITPKGRAPALPASLAAALARLPEDRPTPLAALAQARDDVGAAPPDMVAVRSAVPGMQAMLVTTLSSQAAYGHLASPWFLGSLSVFPLLVVGAALRLRRLQGHNEVLADEILRREAAQAELQRHGDQLETLVARRSAELNRLFHALPDLYFRVGRDGTIHEHRAGRDADLLMPPERFLGRRMQDVLPASAAAILERAMGELERGADHAVAEYALDMPAGRTHFEARLLPLGDDQRVIVVRNVTDRREVEEVREANRREAERLVRVKSEFLANMSHEIRTPLNAVLGLAQIGARNPAAGSDRASFQRIEEAGRHLLGIIDDILDLSKLEAGKLSVERQPFQLSAMVDAAVGLVAGRTAAKGLALRVALDPALPDWVQGDALRLKQVLVNLLTNAVKFTAAGEVSLTVGMAADEVNFSVRDTGIGMDEALLRRLFQPFEQADGSTSRRYGGTGLGLAISHNLAGLMGGRIEVASTVGVGSRFTLHVPLPRAAALPDRPGTARRGINRLAGLRVLAAEDMEVNRLVLESQLRLEGARAVFAEDGRQAVEAVRRAEPGYFDAVLMDVQMPVMDGLTATRELHRLAPGLPVIGLTAHALAEERDRCLAAGMVEHVVKPVDLDLLVAAVRRHAARRPEATATGPMPLQEPGTGVAAAPVVEASGR